MLHPRFHHQAACKSQGSQPVRVCRQPLQDSKHAHGSAARFMRAEGRAAAPPECEQQAAQHYSGSSHPRPKLSTAQLSKRLRGASHVQSAGPLLTSHIKLCRTWQEACELFVTFSDLFNTVHTVALVSQLARILPAPSQLQVHEQSDVRVLLMDLLQFAEQEVPSCSPRELANLAHGFAKLGCLSRRFLQLVCARTPPRRLRECELAMLVWAAATAKCTLDEQWLQELYVEVPQRLPHFQAKELVMLLWSLARMESLPALPGTMLSSITARLHRLLPTFTPLDFSNTSLALATLSHHPGQKFLDACIEAACPSLASFNALQLADFLWGLQQLHYQPSPLMWLALDGMLLRLAPELATAPDLTARLLYNMAKLQQSSMSQQSSSLRATGSRVSSMSTNRGPSMGTAYNPKSSSSLTGTGSTVAEAKSRPVPSLHPSDHSADSSTVVSPLSQTAGSCQQPPSGLPHMQPALPIPHLHASRPIHHPTSSYPSLASLPNLLLVTEDSLPLFSPQDMSNSMWALAQLRCRPPDSWLAQLLEISFERMSEFSAQQLTNTLCALARMEYLPSDKWLARFKHCVLSQLDNFSSQHVANVLVAYCRLHYRPSERVVSLFLQRFVSSLDDSVLQQQPIANVMWALPQVVCPHRLPVFVQHHADQLARLQAASLQLLNSSKPAELVQLLVGAANLACTVDVRWLDSLKCVCQERRLEFNWGERMQVQMSVALLQSHATDEQLHYVTDALRQACSAEQHEWCSVIAARSSSGPAPAKQPATSTKVFGLGLQAGVGLQQGQNMARCLQA